MTGWRWDDYAGLRGGWVRPVSDDVEDILFRVGREYTVCRVRTTDGFTLVSGTGSTRAHALSAMEGAR